LEASRGLLNPQRGHDLLQLLLETVNRDLTGAQPSQFGARPDSMAKQFVSALHNLQRLAKIVTGYGK
jgi:hypothetical protein